MSVKIPQEPDKLMAFQFCQSNAFIPSTQIIIRQITYSWEPWVAKVRRRTCGVVIVLLMDIIS